MDSMNANALTTPIKSQPSRSSISNEIATPDKPLEARGRRVAMSVKEVKNISEGLRENKKGPSDRGRSDDDLSSAEVMKSPGRKTLARLPGKYEILAEFFNSVVSSIRLIRMKGASPTFPIICASIQNLTDRRFTYKHLAQLKYILPETIGVKKVLLHDEVTCCMKPDLHVTLQVDAIGDNEKGKEGNEFLSLRRGFRERLANFSQEHPEEEDIPEYQLPHPFNQTKPDILPNGYSPSVYTCPEEQFSCLSHMPRSFRRSFSQKLPIPESQKTTLECYIKAISKIDPLTCVAPSPVKSTTKLPFSEKSISKIDPLTCVLPSSSSSTLIVNEEEADKFVISDGNCQKQLHVLDGTPAKPVSTPARLMVATPQIQTPKMCLSPMDCNSPPLTKSKKRSARTQLFTTLEDSTKDDEESNAEGSSVDDVISFLPQSLLQSVREKERKSLEEKDAIVAQAKRQQKLIAGLPDVFDMVRLMFQSWKPSVMTKQELIYKIIANNIRIVDRDEVEDQLKMLQELVPEWISEKTALSGDILCWWLRSRG